MMPAFYSNLIVNDAELTVLDYETTGSVRGFPVEPWQIGMVTLKDGIVDPDSMFESLIRIDINRPFNPYAPGRHAQVRDDLAEAPTLPEIWRQTRQRLTNRPLCAHNVATEKKFTRRMAPMHGFGPWIDTLKIARKVWPGCPSYALEDLILQMGLIERIEKLCPGRQAHDALYDAVASAVLLSHLFSQTEWARVTVAELASI